MEISELSKSIGGIWFCEIGDDQYVIIPLMFHCSLLVNPKPIGGYEERYCFSNPAIAIKAIQELEQNNQELKYWQKHHNKGISIKGTFAYKNGEHQIPEHALYQVDWNSDDLNKQYPYEMLIV